MTKSDGAVIISTKMDTSGMQAGLNQIEGSISKLGSGLKKLGGIIGTVFAIKEIVSFSRECIDLGSDLEEVQNVVDVTFGKMSGVIEKFSKEAATQFGISELAAKQYTSTIGAMYKSMGFSEDAAAGMSIEMTKLAADMASFYNLDADTAFAKIRSGISGETEPLKQLGINLSEVNLEEYRLAQGIETSYKAMNQQDKALLRYNYLLSVTSDAQGDFARTSGSWANQVKVLHLQFQSIKADLGAGFINLFLPILQVINKLLQGIAKLASAFKAFTELITGKKSTGATSASAIDTSDITAATDAYGDAADATQDYADATDKSATATKKAAKENKRYISGLDEIRHYETNSNSDAGNTGSKNKAGKTSTPSAIGAADLAPVNFGKLAEGETTVDKLATKMKELYDTIVRGVQPTVEALKRLWNEGLSRLGQFSWRALKDFYTGFLVPVGQWVFGEGLPRFIDALNDGLMAVDWQKINDGLSNLWDSLTPFAINVGEGLLWFWENVLVPFKTWTYNEAVPRFLETVSNILDISTAILEAAQPGWEWFWENILLPIAQWTGGVFLTVWDQINDLLADFAQWCRENPAVIENVTTFVAAFFTALAGIAVITKVWTMITSIGTLISTIGGIIGSLNPVTIAIAAAVAVGVLLYKNWDVIKAKAKEVWDYVKKKFTEVKEAASKKFGEIKTTIGTAWDNITTAAKTAWINLKTDLGNRWDAIKGKAVQVYEAIRNKISTTWDEVKTAIGTKWALIKKDISDRWDAISGKATSIYEGIRDTIGGAWDAVQKKTTEIWGTVKDALIGEDGIWEKLSSKATTIYESVRDAVGGAWDTIQTKTTTIWDAVSEKLVGEGGVWGTIKSGAEDIFGPMADYISEKWGAVKDAVNGLIMWVNETFAIDWESAWNGIVDTFGNIFAGIGDFFKDPINTVIGMLNTMIETVNSALGAIESAFTFDFSWTNPFTRTKHDWVYSLSLPRISTIPELAKGAVIPPNSPFLATLGDQRSGTNIEAPLDTIKDAVRDVVGSGDINLTITLDGRVIYQNVLKQARQQQQANGFNPFSAL